MSQLEARHYSFYCCYLLRSSPKPRSFYIGSTPDPVRRLRQHNGELTAGAYRTKRQGSRPWNIGMLVYGFPTKIHALMFEHAWQHPYQTRHIPVESRVTKKRGSGNGMAHRVANVRLLLRSEFFRRLKLKICIFDPEIHETWVKNKFGVDLEDPEVHFPATEPVINSITRAELNQGSNLDSDTTTNVNYNVRRNTEATNTELTTNNSDIVGDTGNFTLTDTDTGTDTHHRDTHLEDRPETGPVSNAHQVKNFIQAIHSEQDRLVHRITDFISQQESLNCYLCKDPIEQGVFPISICPFCMTVSHLNCISKSSSDLIPTTVECPTCLNTISWTQLIQISKTLSNLS